jgi:hypothetical protein
MHWTEERTAKTRIGQALRTRGWTIYGFKEDRSDIRTDYYDPASWDGVATHPRYPGIVACVKVGEYAVEHASGKDGWPTFRATPSGKAWHIQKGDVIVGRGVGLSKCAGNGAAWKKGVAQICDAIERAARQNAGKTLPNSMTASTAYEDGVKIEHDRDWTWVFFPAKPDKTTRDRLKDMGARWGSKRGGWYLTRHVPLEEFAWLTGEANPSQVQDPPPSEQDAYDYLPDFVLARLPKLYATEGQDDPVVQVKYFLPEGRLTYYGIEYSPIAPDETPDLLFGYLVSPLGPDCDELCYMTLEQIKTMRSPTLNLPVERDLWFRPKPLSEVRAKLAGNGDAPDPKPVVPDPEPTTEPPAETAAAVHAEQPSPLPDGWAADDIRHLLSKLESEPVLVADAKLEIPTIHDLAGEARHLGFGFFEVTAPTYKLQFNGGGAMQHTPSGRGWTYLRIDGHYVYDTEGVRARLEAWLAAANATGVGAQDVEPVPGAAVEQDDRLPDATYGATTDGDGTVQARGGPAGSLTIVYLDDGNIVWTGDVRCFADHGEQQFQAAWQWLQQGRTKSTRLLSKSYYGDRHAESRGKLSEVDALRRAVQSCYAEPDVPEDWDNPGLHLAAHIRALLLKAYLDVQDRDGRVFYECLASTFDELTKSDGILGRIELTFSQLWSPDRWVESLDREVLKRKSWRYVPADERRLAQKLRGNRDALLEALPKATGKRETAILSELADLGQVPDEYVPAERAGMPALEQPDSQPDVFSITLEQWLDLDGHEVQRTGSDMRYVGTHGQRTLWPGVTGKREVIVCQHRCEVERAIVEGHPITADVANEYPDLAVQADEKGLIHPPVDATYRPVWMHTRREFSVSHPIEAAGVPIGKTDRAKERYHEIVVAQAVERGYPVPERVLDSCPQLRQALVAASAESLIPIGEWDIGWETWPISKTGSTTCSRCQAQSQAGEDWYRGWKDNHQPVYLCPSCQDTLHTWSQEQLETKLAEDQARLRQVRIAQIAKWQEIVDGKPLACKHPNKVCSEAPTRIVTLSEGELTVEMALCESCCDLMRRTAKHGGYRFSSHKLESTPTAKAEPDPKENAYTDNDVATYEDRWDVYFETGAVATVRRTVRRIDSVGVLRVAFDRADRGPSASTLEERRKIIQRRIRQLEKAA